ncbi:hypothetical protein E2553_05005 [Paraburkholderia dipogonis]|uniref:DNA-binding protein n=1 Tax=Paraburkholderia dipogonis TaxID=1211383 RepID=A0A4Y8N3Z6_9BURK|nr:hypothetical protein [Paraburkholderia dipogonis]TFE44444.1 hypothetical protein E2553_05005 [Paraburkholderia dipogonis]
MRDLYASHAAALRDALRHAVERGGMSSLGVLHQGVPSPSTLTGTDATAQAARVRRQLDRLAPLSRALLVIAYAPRALKCSCGTRCCSGSYPNPEWEDAMRATLAHVAPLLTGKAANEWLHRAIVANVLTRTKETAVSLAERCGVHRLTVAAHVGIIEAELVGNRHTQGRFDHASERIDTHLREAGILADSNASAANDAHARAA